MKSKYIIFIFFIIFIIFLIIIYNLQESGNNIINQNQKKIIEKILTIKEYKAKLKVTVYSNKNQNQYEIEQFENIEQNKSSMKVINNSDISDVIIELKDNTLSITNTDLNLKKLYKNYMPITKNYLFISNFFEKVDLEKNEETDEYIILTANGNNERYLHKQTLYINKRSNLPEKMIIMDNEQNVKTIIEYIEIELK